MLSTAYPNDHGLQAEMAFISQRTAVPEVPGAYPGKKTTPEIAVPVATWAPVSAPPPARLVG